jgi:hypothetical protein
MSEGSALNFAKRKQYCSKSGYFQIGVSSKKGFNLVPIINDIGKGNCNVSFLGWDVIKIGSGETLLLGTELLN